jgi:hypothetical protein
VHQLLSAAYHAGARCDVHVRDAAITDFKIDADGRPHAFPATLRSASAPLADYVTGALNLVPHRAAYRCFTPPTPPATPLELAFHPYYSAHGAAH